MLERIFLIACLALLGGPAAAQNLLDPSVAFRTAVRLVRPGLIEIRYDTAPGYYLYRDRLEYRLQPDGARIGKPRFPPGKVKNDEFFGKVVIYRKQTIVQIPFSAEGVAGPLSLIADLQGCADVGVCYPPVRRTFALSASAAPQ
jgi:thiol:disulfide interchange protein DsbD